MYMFLFHVISSSLSLCLSICLPSHNILYIYGHFSNRLVCNLVDFFTFLRWCPPCVAPGCVALCLDAVPSRSRSETYFSKFGFEIGGLEIWKKKFPCHSGQNMKASCLVMTGPKTMKKHWVFLIFSSKHVVLLRKSWCFWVLKAIRDPGWPHQFRAAKKNIEKPWVFELYFWQPSSWPAKLSS